MLPQTLGHFRGKQSHSSCGCLEHYSLFTVVFIKPVTILIPASFEFFSISSLISVPLASSQFSYILLPSPCNAQSAEMGAGLEIVCLCCSCDNHASHSVISHNAPHRYNFLILISFIIIFLQSFIIHCLPIMNLLLLKIFYLS